MEDRKRVAISEFISDRTPRPLMAPMLTFNLPMEVARLQGEVEYEKGHNGRTLIKHSEFRLVLVALKAGSELHQLHTDERIALHPLRGHLRLHFPSEVMNIHPDQLISLDRDLAFRIEAVEDSEFLLWVGWSKGVHPSPSQ